MRGSRTFLIGWALVACMARAGAENTALPTYVSTPEGYMHTEDRYIPGVTHAELGWFTSSRTECIKAQSIAARTYVLRWLNANGHTSRIPALGPSFQAWTASFSSATLASSKAVEGQVMTYADLVIYSNYASGAWTLDSEGWPFAPSSYKYPADLTWDGIRSLYLDWNAGRISSATWRERVTSHNAWAWTYILNTDNEGRTGDAVIPTIHNSRTVRNRGGLGQYRAYWLDAHRSYDYRAILRSFYGEDVTIVGAEAPAPALPDLTVTALDTSNASGDESTIGVGHSVHLRCTVTNAGEGAVSAETPIGVGYFAGGTYIGFGIVWVDLAAGASIEIGQDSGEWSPGRPGVTTLTAFADDVDRIGESDEGNNKRSITRRAHLAIGIDTSVLNVRSGPGTSHAILGVVRSGQRYVARDASGDWYQIFYKGGTTGWIHGGYTSPAADATVVRIAAADLNVRAGPSTGYSILGTATRDQLYVSGAESGGWHRIWWAGRTGWVAGTSAVYSVSLRL